MRFVAIFAPACFEPHCKTLRPVIRMRPPRGTEWRQDWGSNEPYPGNVSSKTHYFSSYALILIVLKSARFNNEITGLDWPELGRGEKAAGGPVATRALQSPRAPQGHGRAPHHSGHAARPRQQRPEARDAFCATSCGCSRASNLCNPSIAHLTRGTERKPKRTHAAC